MRSRGELLLLAYDLVRHIPEGALTRRDVQQPIQQRIQRGTDQRDLPRILRHATLRATTSDLTARYREVRYVREPETVVGAITSAVNPASSFRPQQEVTFAAVTPQTKR